MKPNNFRMTGYANIMYLQYDCDGHQKHQRATVIVSTYCGFISKDICSSEFSENIPSSLLYNQVH